ncbi:MAG: hypothetical protein RLZZ266_1094, partial [Bacteroidota bacterium]
FPKIAQEVVHLQIALFGEGNLHF